MPGRGRILPGSDLGRALGQPHARSRRADNPDRYASRVLELPLRGYWRMGDGGTVLRDVLRELDGTYTGSPPTADSLVVGGDLARSFNGSSQYATVPDQAKLDISGPFTLLAWVKLTALPAAGQLGAIAVKTDSTGNWAYGYHVKADGTIEAFSHTSGAGSPVATSSGTLDLDTPYLVATRWNGTALEVLIDAVVDGQHVGAHNPFAGNDVFGIGAGRTGVNKLNGVVDEVALVDGALSDATIGELLDIGRGDFGTTHVTTSVRVKWDVRARVTAARVVKWNSRARVSASRRIVWHARARVSAARRVVWNVIGHPTATLRLLWTDRGHVVVQRRIAWDVRARVSASRRIVWDARARVTAARRVVWDALRRVSAAVALLWTDRSHPVAQRRIVWDVEESEETTHVTTSLRVSWDVEAAPVVETPEPTHIGVARAQETFRRRVVASLRVSWDVEVEKADLGETVRGAMPEAPPAPEPRVRTPRRRPQPRRPIYVPERRVRVTATLRVGWRTESPPHRTATLGVAWNVTGHPTATCRVRWDVETLPPDDPRVNPEVDDEEALTAMAAMLLP